MTTTSGKIKVVKNLIFHKNLLLLFFIAFSLQFSAQMFVQEGAVLSLNKGTLIYADSIVYDNAIQSEHISTVRVANKVFVSKDSKPYITDDSSQLNFADGNASEKNPAKVASKSIEKKIVDVKPTQPSDQSSEYLHRVFKNSPLEDFRSSTEQHVVAVVTNGSSKNRKLVITKNDSLHLIQPGYSDILVIEFKKFCEISLPEICQRSFLTRPPPFI